MYLIRGIGNLETFHKKFPNQLMSGTIGNFDGLHLGHQAILNQVIEKANESCIVWYFLQSLTHLSTLLLRMKTPCLRQEFVLGEKS